MSGKYEPTIHNPIIHHCPLLFRVSKSHGKLCDSCFGSFSPGITKYNCTSCSYDLCMTCFARKCHSQPMSQKLKSNMIQILDDPNSAHRHQHEIVEIKPNETSNIEFELNKESKMIIQASIQLFTDDFLNGEKVAKIISSLSNKEFKDSVKEDMIRELCREVGLEIIDSTGLLGAFEFCEAMAIGDFQTAGEKAALVLVMKMAGNLVCTIC